MSDQRYWEKRANSYDTITAVLAGPMKAAMHLTADSVRGQGRVLEVAAGTGLFTAAIAKTADEVVATDYATAMVSMLEKRVQQAGLKNVRCEQADIAALHFDRASFDCVVAANVLHLMPDVDATLAALRKVLRPGGKLVLPTFCHDETRLSSFVSRLMGFTGFPIKHRFSTFSFREALADAGLHVTHFKTLPGLIPVGYVEGTFETNTE
ncbi:MAG: SAM-dependent methyltransferase [Desulfovibrio sp.]|nr:SAM-dependent methyltransferase [Desulfovibrio sp.]|tara:strand:- start:3363 stop:3989 length:627 start_codon:yes stop_codon:yes gene_type:complete